jgi:tetratricopeptide (TPR) repeat protein
MQSADEPSEPDADSAGASVSPRRGALVVVASVILLVAALYVITEVSQEQTSGQSRAAADPALVPRTDPVPEEIAGDVDAIVAELPALSGPELQAKRRQLVDLYSKAGRLDLAGPVQEEIASDLDTEAEWIRAGNAYYDWMEMQTGTPRTYFARKAISAYQRALEINPGNHDVRTDMAIAYLYDPENTMQAILNTNMVLGEDSTHVQANFNRGIMLLQIGRFEQAKDQFRKVLELVGDPQSAVYQRAEAALRRLGEE